jgi:hypothetical protein
VLVLRQGTGYGVVLLRTGAPGPASCAGYQPGLCTVVRQPDGTGVVLVADLTPPQPDEHDARWISAYHTRRDGSVVQITALAQPDEKHGVFWETLPGLPSPPLTRDQAIALATTLP